VWAERHLRFDKPRPDERSATEGLPISAPSAEDGRLWRPPAGQAPALPAPLDAGTALVRRASVYVDGRGQQLGPPKTEGARGEHRLMPTVVALLVKRREQQEQERAAAPTWKQISYEGERLNLVFTNPTGGLVLR
jgi:hypothetical protein